MGELLKGRDGTKMHNPPKAVPILGLASDGHHTFLTGGGGGSTASKEVPNQVQVHSLDEATGKVVTTGTLNTEKSVVVYLAHVPSNGFWLAGLGARCKVLEIAEDGCSLKEICEWTCEQKGRAPEVNVARASSSGELVATGGTDGCVRIWRFAKARETPTLHKACLEQKNEVLDVDFSPDGNLLVSCERGGPCRLWDTSSGEERSQLKYERSGKPLSLKSARFIVHPEQGTPMLVVAGNVGPRDPSYIGLFSTDGSKLGEVQVDKLPITALGLDARGQLAAVTLASGGAKVYSLPTLRLLKGVKGVHELPAPGVAILGETVLSAGGDRTINLLSFSRSGGGGACATFLYMCILIAVLFVLVYLTLRIGLKGAALQQGSKGEL
uniref:Anaphase-promoting complex subunit 4 WD40 domain-containing protein n=1 Tax=Alexandrium andersonii TaxID=327968 RepID=A0A7S2F1Z5_9DINO|mmetsp:Transcript_12791/g.29005  ORF Transcript_12791/g.29005 Transcript_12791/m.29005 type:complete len:382 (+) Transcript_12791:68-1213(+)